MALQILKSHWQRKWWSYLGVLLIFTLTYGKNPGFAISFSMLFIYINWQNEIEINKIYAEYQHAIFVNKIVNSEICRDIQQMIKKIKNSMEHQESHVTTLLENPEKTTLTKYLLTIADKYVELGEWKPYCKINRFILLMTGMKNAEDVYSMLENLEDELKYFSNNEVKEKQERIVNELKVNTKTDKK